MCLLVQELCILKAEHLQSQCFTYLGPELCACADTDGADADFMVTFVQGKAKASPGASASKQGASPSPAVHTGSSKCVGGASTPRAGEPVTPAQSKAGKKQVGCCKLLLSVACD